MKKLIALCVMLGMTTAFAGFDMQTEMRTGWTSTTVGDADAETATETSIGEFEFGYRGEIKEGWSLKFTTELHKNPMTWRYGYLQKQMDQFTFRVGRIGILTDDYENFNPFTVNHGVNGMLFSLQDSPVQDGAEVAYEFIKGHNIKLQSHLNADKEFGSLFASYYGGMDMAKWAVYYTKAIDAAASTQASNVGGDLAVMLKDITLTFDYRNYKEDSDADASTSMIFGAKYAMGAYTPYAHVVMDSKINDKGDEELEDDSTATDAEKAADNRLDDIMTIDLGVKMNWGGPNWYVGGKYLTYSDKGDNKLDDKTEMKLYAGLEYDFGL